MVYTLPKINVSFKQTTRDMKLYTIANGKEEKSEFIKDAIEYYAEFLEEKDKQTWTKQYYSVEWKDA